MLDGVPSVMHELAICGKEISREELLRYQRAFNLGLALLS
jgi:hypothetical protein